MMNTHSQGVYIAPSDFTRTGNNPVYHATTAAFEPITPDTVNETNSKVNTAPYIITYQGPSLPTVPISAADNTTKEVKKKVISTIADLIKNLLGFFGNRGKTKSYQAEIQEKNNHEYRMQQQAYDHECRMMKQAYDHEYRMQQQAYDHECRMATLEVESRTMLTCNQSTAPSSPIIADSQAPTESNPAENS